MKLKVSFLQFPHTHIIFKGPTEVVWTHGSTNLMANSSLSSHTFLFQLYILQSNYLCTNNVKKNRLLCQEKIDLIKVIVNYFKSSKYMQDSGKYEHVQTKNKENCRIKLKKAIKQKQKTILTFIILPNNLIKLLLKVNKIFLKKEQKLQVIILRLFHSNYTLLFNEYRWLELVIVWCSNESMRKINKWTVQMKTKRNQRIYKIKWQIN